MVSSFEADDDTNYIVGVGQEKNDYASYCFIDAVRSRMKMEREKSYSTADLPSQKWNGSTLQQCLYFGTGPFEEGGGRVLAVKVFAITVLLADEHQA